MRNIFIFLPFLLILAACGDAEFEHICHDGSNERPCRKDEIAMIDGIHFIIKAIGNNDGNQASGFFREGNSTKNVRIHLFGEIHTDVMCQIQNLNFLNQTFGAGDIILLEGGDMSRPVRPSCISDLVFEIYATWAFEQNGKPYDPKERRQFADGLVKTYLSTKKSYDFGKLNLADVACGFWDDSNALKSGISRQSLVMRNTSMVKAIKNKLTKYHKVAVIAGAAHVPYGDWLSGKKQNSHRTDFPSTVAEFYHVVDGERKKPKPSRTFNIRQMGTTKVIRDYLESSGHSYADLIHKHIINTFY